MSTNGGSGGGTNDNKDKAKEKTALANLDEKDKAKAHMGSEDGGFTIKPQDAASTPYAGTNLATAHRGSEDGGDTSGRLSTTVKQKPGENTPIPDGSENTSVTSPRTDSSVVLAGQVGLKKNRSPARSNNFVSLASGAGSLGRKPSNSKRSLIGGA
jgi:hypothetical protein